MPDICGTRCGTNTGHWGHETGWGIGTKTPIGVCPCPDSCDVPISSTPKANHDCCGCRGKGRSSGRPVPLLSKEAKRVVLGGEACAHMWAQCACPEKRQHPGSDQQKTRRFRHHPNIARMYGPRRCASREIRGMLSAIDEVKMPSVVVTDLVISAGPMDSLYACDFLAANGLLETCLVVT